MLVKGATGVKTQVFNFHADLTKGCKGPIGKKSGKSWQIKGHQQYSKFLIAKSGTIKLSPVRVQNRISDNVKSRKITIHKLAHI